MLYGATDPCILHFQLLLENPVQIIQADLHRTDINDHSTEFLERNAPKNPRERPDTDGIL